TNQKAGSSNLSGRAIYPQKFIAREILLSLRELRISPAGSRSTHACIPAQVRISQGAPSVPRNYHVKTMHQLRLRTGIWTGLLALFRKMNVNLEPSMVGFLDDRVKQPRRLPRPPRQQCLAQRFLRWLLRPQQCFHET